jgi:hypothetical protein
VYPSYGSNHGYQIAVPVSGGNHRVCAYGINAAGGGTNTELRCVTIFVADSPMGSLDVAKATTNAVVVKGWSVDPDTAAFTKVHFYIDGRFASMTDANKPRVDIGAMLPAYGSNHGYDTYMAVGSGNHAVCAYGINAAGTGTNTMLGCRYFTISGDPRGSLDVASSPQAGRLRVAGWAYDPDAPLATTAIHVYVDNGFAGVFQANGLRTDIGSAFGVGNNHGYDATLSVARGTHTVCTYAINAAGIGTNPQLGCRSVSVG